MLQGSVARRALVAAAAFLTLATPSARAHVMPAHQGTLALRGRQAYLALSLPALLFREADDDGDGRLSVAEALGHAELLQRLVATRVHLADERGAGRLVHAQVIIERLDDDTAAVQRPVKDVLVLVVAAFDRDPSSLRLSVDGLATIARLEPGADSLTVRASHPGLPNGTTDVGTLTAGRDHVTLFASPSRLAALRDELPITGRAGIVAALALLIALYRGAVFAFRRFVRPVVTTS